MFVEVVDRAAEAMTSVIAGVDIDCLPGTDAEALLEVFIKAERVAAAGRLLLSGRIAETNRWSADRRCRSPGDYLARRTGLGYGQAARSLDTASRLRDLPHLTRELAQGHVSASQAGDIAEAAAGAPDTEAELVDLAKAGDSQALKQRCRQVKANQRSAEDAQEAHRRIHRGRYLRTWTGDDGAFMGQFRLTPEAGARLASQLQWATEQIFDQARRQGRFEARDAYRADALIDLICDRSAQPADAQTNRTDPAPPAGANARKRRGPASGPRADITVFVDYEALIRGYPMGEERCEIAGLGPVPVSLVHDLANDCWLRAVITKGVDVQAIAHAGRNIPAHIRTALNARDQECVVPGCHARQGLQIDHWQIDYHKQGPTELWNLTRLCKIHHFQKTHQGAKLAGGPGQWTWQPPSRQ